MDSDDLSCSKCEYEGKDNDSLSNHKVVNHENRISDEDVVKMGGKVLTEFFCKECQFVAENSEDLEVHNQISHKLISNPEVKLQDAHIVEEVRYSCGNCVFTTEENEILNSHIGENHTPNATQAIILSCKKCSFQGNNEEGLRVHMNEKHLIINVYNCTSCEFGTTNHNGLKDHMDTSHKSAEVKEKSTCLDGAEKPLDVTSGDKGEAEVSIFCPFCKLESKNEAYLKVHIQNVHLS